MGDMINFQAFDAQVTKLQIHAAQKAKPHTISKNAWVVIILAVAAGYSLLRVWALGLGADLWLTSFLVNFIPAFAAGMIVWWVSITLLEKAAERRIRFERFARDNNLTYYPESVEPTYQGIIFSTGGQRALYDRFGGDGFEIGNYRYTVQHGKSSTTYKFGYARIDLKRHVAHMLLDAKSNNTRIIGLNISNLPVTLNADQTLSLEGDFNEYFTLYAPKEYERDALYIFTPDLMALLIDQVAQFDVEVIDDQLFVYGKEFNFIDRTSWQRIFGIIRNVGQKTISQTDYYADEKIGDRTQDIIAEPGRRLRRGLSWYTVIFIVLWILGYILQIVFAR